MKYLILFLFINTFTYSQLHSNYEDLKQNQDSLHSLMDEFGNYRIDLEMEALKSQYKEVNCYEQVQTNQIYFEYILANEYISELMIIYRIEEFVNKNMMGDYSELKETYINLNIQQLEYIKKKFQSYITQIENDAIKRNIENSVNLFDDTITKLTK